MGLAYSTLSLTANLFWSLNTDWVGIQYLKIYTKYFLRIIICLLSILLLAEKIESLSIATNFEASVPLWKLVFSLIYF